MRYSTLTMRLSLAVEAAESAYNDAFDARCEAERREALASKRLGRARDRLDARREYLRKRYGAKAGAA